jgi:hypothetical protein
MDRWAACPEVEVIDGDRVHGMGLSSPDQKSLAAAAARRYELKRTDNNLCLFVICRA